MIDKKDTAASDALNAGAMAQLETAYTQSAAVDRTIAQEFSGTDDDGLEEAQW